MPKNHLPMSSSLEDYLEAIAEILEKNEHAHTKDIALKLGVSMPSVTNALQALAARGLIVYRSHAPVMLTDSGSAKAAIIRRRHQAFCRFLSQLLKVDPAQADAAACRIEHVIGEPITTRMTALIEAVEQREDCAGLRAYLDETMPKIQTPDIKGLISLDKLDKGHPAEIVYISENLRGIKKFADMGIVPGAVVEYEGTAPFGDLIRIRLMDTQLSLRTGDAQYIWVRVLD
ncbi:MAG: metal-dependent transcriptional regulator [Lentisphaerae bacterium]|nr:metal-dependent transcriptional regulator [Lentisphaerota bacterium]